MTNVIESAHTTATLSDFLSESYANLDAAFVAESSAIKSLAAATNRADRARAKWSLSDEGKAAKNEESRRLGFIAAHPRIAVALANRATALDLAVKNRQRCEAQAKESSYHLRILELEAGVPRMAY